MDIVDEELVQMVYIDSGSELTDSADSVPETPTSLAELVMSNSTIPASIPNGFQYGLDSSYLTPEPTPAARHSSRVAAPQSNGESVNLVDRFSADEEHLANKSTDKHNFPSVVYDEMTQLHVHAFPQYPVPGDGS